MKIEERGTNFLKISLLQEGTIDKVSFDRMKHLDCILPFEYVYNEENRILYRTGNYIPLAEFFNIKTLNFTEAKGLLLSWIMAFESVSRTGGKCGNLVTDMDYVYIDPVTGQLRFIYLPVLIEIKNNNFRNALKELIFSIRVKDAEILLGMVVEQLGKIGTDDAQLYEDLRECINKADQNVKIVEKEVEVERIVEKIIEKPQKQKRNIGRNLVGYTILCSLSMVILPLLLSNVIDSSLLSKPHLIKDLICLLTILLGHLYTLQIDKKNIDNKTIITMEPEKNVESQKK